MVKHNITVLHWKVDGVTMRALNPLHALEYHSGRGGRWKMNATLVNPAEERGGGGMFYSKTQKRIFRYEVPTSQVAVAVSDPLQSQTSGANALGGATVGMLLAGPIGALAGGAMGANDGGDMLVLRFPPAATGGVQVETLIKLTGMMFRDLRTNLAIANASSS